MDAERLLRTLVDSDVEITLQHVSGCAAQPPMTLDGKCPACMWIQAAGETRALLGLSPLEPGKVRDARRGR